MSDSLDAAAPEANAAVMASAGTGKTWLLVTRIVRLLLAGARPGGILAITFTRKAAAEMLTRLEQRLWGYVQLSDEALDQALADIGVAPDKAARERARALYEQLLFSEQPIRTATFHAFCQEILQRFPLEASIPPGFELLDNEGMLRSEAWDALYSEATRRPDGATAAALEVLFDRCGGLHNTHQVLETFLHLRSDWWAFVEGRRQPPEWALQQLCDVLDVDPSVDYFAQFFTRERCEALNTYADFLDRHRTATNTQQAAALRHALGCDNAAAGPFERIRAVLFTSTGSPRKRKESNAQRRSLGAEGEQAFLQLHDELCAAVAQTVDRNARINTLALSRAWYTAGARLLQHYQRIKEEQRWLDFADLEWKTYQLLNHEDNAYWVQYKLDQRIDHLLVDEFQDTNPTQWRLLLPLLEEIAAGETERPRSVFLVGDAKQSIYGFRRADPRLLATAVGWLRNHLGATDYTLDRSRRSAQAVIDCVNAVFGPQAPDARLLSFKPHATYHGDVCGRVELLPLAVSPAVTATVDGNDDGRGLRDPLRQARQVEEDLRHYMEGRMIADRIETLIDQALPVIVSGGARAVQYSDVYILTRKRTHAGSIERALREAGIPYVGADRGTLLSSLEIRDLEALLTILIVPYNNLALAQVLRSPVFSASDDDLLQLASAANGGSWLERLQALAPQLPEHSPLVRAERLLRRWSEWAGRIPVHDLLDRIYAQADVIGRYQAAFPQSLRPRARANLTRFIELALEVDSGRYPSLPHFLNRLRELRRHELEAPDAPPAGGPEDRVRILTIHAAKGLEAPVVFLADSADAPARPGGYQAVVDWPTEAERPRAFFLTGKRSQHDSVSRRLLENQEQARQREDANLLYVALTRARQYLFITGAAPARGTDLGWYGAIRDGLEPVADARGDILVLESGTPPPAITPPPGAAAAPVVDERLTRPLAVSSRRGTIAPSHGAHEADPSGAPEEDARIRGLAIHRMLELLTSAAAWPVDRIAVRVAGELQLSGSDPRLGEWMDEARAVVEAPQLADLFRPDRYQHAFNEVPVQYRHNDWLVHGVIDRVVRNGGQVLVVDYKTHSHARVDDLARLAATYQDQMRWYVRGVRRIWPDCRVQAGLLFTACRALHPLVVE
ncbi:MAG: UvrD-helicase domain-containing protein [Gammaproteobacteria bacterium]